jgi:DNA-binding NtrC family response regulator
VPPLRSRKDDIPRLANFFLARYNQKLGKNIEVISDGAMAKLEAYNYPGNIRELENIIERAVMLTRNNVILPFAIANHENESIETENRFQISDKDFSTAREKLISQFEKQFITERLQETNGNISKAAKASNMSRQNFHRLMEKHNISLQ